VFGSQGTDDDKHFGRAESEAFGAYPTLMVSTPHPALSSFDEYLFSVGLRL
jgi:hypothetical protein